MPRRFAWLLLAVVCSEQVCLAQPFVERVWPPVLRRGEATRVEFSGTQLEQPLGAWASIPGVDIQAVPTGMATEETVSVDISIPAAAPLGLYGLRLATASGLSNVHLVLIDELPVTARNRPHAVIAESTVVLALPACLAAPVRKAEIDRYALDVTAGQRVTLEVVGNRLGKNFDPVVTIRDLKGKFVARCDNSVGLLFDCRFAHTFAAAGRYFIEVTDARFAGDPTWSYVLRVGDFPEARTALPAAIPAGEETVVAFPQVPEFFAAAKPQATKRSAAYFQEVRFAAEKPATWIPLMRSDRPLCVEQEPNDLPEQATTAASPVALSAELCGVLSRPGDEDWFQFPLIKGQTLRVRSFTQAIGSAADLEVILFEPTNEPAGREVIRSDETSAHDGSRNTHFVEEANLTFGVRTDGLHRLLIRDLTGDGSPAHTYRVEIGENIPELRLKAEVAEIALPRGTWQPIPLTVTRTGFSEPIQLELIGAPAGVVLEQTVIPKDDKEFVCRLVASRDVPEGLATLQIVGRAAANERLLEAVATVHPLVDRQPMNKDRILYALRPDQRDLPPSLTDRIALQVLTPSPFDFDLPDQQVLLPKYQTANIRLETRRDPGFNGPIGFSARGGQIGDQREERVQVYFNAPAATPETPSIVGTFANRILTQYQKHRVDVTATSMSEGRTIRLTRTFQLDVRAAFEPKFEPAEIELLPGEKKTVQIAANRVPTYEGELTLTNSNPQTMLQVPEAISLPKDRSDLPLEIAVKPDTNPGRYELRYEASANVGRFQESVRSAVLAITVKKPEAKK